MSRLTAITALRRPFWMVLSAAMLAVSYRVSTTATIGGWDIHVMGVRHAAVWDPGGPYLGSGIMLFDNRYAPFVGHPGLPLTALCQLVARVLWFPFSGQVAFDQFCAQHLYIVTVAAMLSMTATFLLAFWVVERLALRVLGSPGQAMLAVLAYATTYPVLFYLNRISPEPLLVVFTLSAFLALWRHYEMGEQPGRWWYLALGAQAAVAAAYTKFMIAGPILAFIPFQLLCRRDQSIRRRTRDAAAFVLLAMPLFAAGTWKTDWTYYFQFWFGYAPGAPRYSTSDHWLVNVIENASVTLPAMLSTAAAQLSPARFAPSLATREGLFFAAEGVFMAVAAAGAVGYFRAAANRPILLQWLLGYVGLTLIPYLQKGTAAWHYLFVQLAVASVFAAYAIARGLQAARRLDIDTPHGWCLGAVAAVALNGLAIVFTTNMRRYDAEQARFWQLYFQAPSTIDAAGRVGLIGAPHITDLMQPINAYLPSTSFVARFQEYFVPITGDESASELERRNIQATVERTDRGLVLRVRNGSASSSASR